jgi:hypothetical protein
LVAPRRWHLRVFRPGQFLQHRLKGLVALGDLLLVAPPQFVRLPQREKMLGFPRPLQGRTQSIRFLLLDLRIAQSQQPRRIPFAPQNGFDQLPAAHARQVADHVVHLEIHPFPRFLHGWLVAAGQHDMVGAQPQVILQAAEVRRGHEAGLAQTVGVQGRLPLAVLPVGLAARQVLHVFAVDDHDREAGLFQHFVRAEPVTAGGFPRHGADAVFFEPVAQGVQLAGGGA